MVTSRRGREESVRPRRVFKQRARPLNAGVRGQLVVSLAARRVVLFGAIAALAYYVLLEVVTPHMPFAAVPAWWRGLWPSPMLAVLSWFGLLNLAAALLSAVPVATYLLWFLGGHGRLVGLVVGLVVGTWLLCTSMLWYPVNAYFACIEILQFLTVGLAVPALAFIARSCPLTSRSSGP